MTAAAVRVLAAIALLALMVAPAMPPAAAGEPGAVPFLQVRIDRVTPEVVTTTSEPVVTVTGAVLNVGDRPVRDVVVRLEHAAAVTASAGLRTNLAGNVDQYEPVADFITLAPELLRGQQVPFTFSYPLRSQEGSSLRIDQPGVYPVMVNVNGTPDYGEPARLDDARFLLPVLGVPPDASTDSAADTLTSVVPPDTSKPVRLTMFWPISDRPRLAAGAPGATTPVRLIDDDLATSLAPGGRLDTLLSAVEFATSPPVDPGGQVGRALCLAVDPDLLVTVNAMTGGYVVNDAPDAGPGTPTHPGAGQDAAVAWLDRLKALAQRMCVAPTTYAQADLDALRRVADPGLSGIATIGAGDIVDQILGVTSVRGASLIADGPLTGPAVEVLSAQGPTVAIGAANVAAQDSATGEPATADLAPVRFTPQLVAVPFDPTVGAALAGAGVEPGVTVVSGSLAGHSAHTRFGGGAAPGCARLAALARPASGHRTAHPDPDATACVEPATRGCAGDTDRGGQHYPLGPRRATAVARADRRGQRGGAAGTWPAARRQSRQPARAFRRRRGLGYRGGDEPGVGADGGADHRRAHRADRRPVHRAAARGHAARAEPVGAARCPQRAGPAAAHHGRRDGRRPARRGHHRQPRRVVHAGHRAQPAAVGAAQRPARADPGPAQRRRAAGDVRHRYGRDRAAAGLPAAARADRGALHSARRGRRLTAHHRRACARRARPAFRAFQRLRQGACSSSR